MFFNMLKNDLKMKKGLNIILFFFIVLASVLMFISASQLYMQITGKERTAKACHTAKLMLMFENAEEDRAEQHDTISKRIREAGCFTDYAVSECLQLNAVQLDFQNVDENNQESFFEGKHFVMTQPREKNLVYDLKDRPFYVQNGTIWISHKMRDITQSSIGDRMQLITPMGRVYSFEIAGFYKESFGLTLFRYFISDDDYAVISKDFQNKTDVYALNTISPEAEGVPQFITNLGQKDNIHYTDAHDDIDLSDDYIIGYIITCAIMLTSIFMLIIILMTIRFTMVSAMRDEEKEIGMMRAMGIDSFRFRWLFAAKYIAFAAVGGVIGILAGLPLSKKVMAMFSGGIILPQTYELILVGAASALLMAGAIILFCLLVMRRINRISVIDAIHGENHGERFGKVSALLLHRHKKMPVPVFLGLSDILTRLKRYLFLLIAYTLGGMLILLSVHLYRSVINIDFMKYYMIYSMDFYPDFSDEMMKEYEKREISENKDFWEIFNEDLEANHIAAHVDIHSASGAKLMTGGETQVYLTWDYDDPDSIIYSKGKAPVLENEAAISSYTAKKRGIQIGDEIELKIDEYSDDMLTFTTKTKKLIVTGTVNVVEFGSPYIIMGSEYHDAYVRMKSYSALRITGEDKQAEFDKMYDLFHGHVITAEEEMHRIMETYELPLRLLRNVVSGTAVFVNVLLTLLYMNIFISEDKAEIALQRCLGFEDRKIRSAQLFRMLTLAVCAILLAILLTVFIGAKAFSLLFGLLDLSGFSFLPMPLFTFVIMPAATVLTVLIPSLIKLNSIHSIAISSIANE